MKSMKLVHGRDFPLSLSHAPDFRDAMNTTLRERRGSFCAKTAMDCCKGNISCVISVQLGNSCHGIEIKRLLVDIFPEDISRFGTSRQVLWFHESGLNHLID